MGRHCATTHPQHPVDPVEPGPGDVLLLGEESGVWGLGECFRFMVTAFTPGLTATTGYVRGWVLDDSLLSGNDHQVVFFIRLPGVTILERGQWWYKIIPPNAHQDAPDTT